MNGHEKNHGMPGSNFDIGIGVTSEVNSVLKTAFRTLDSFCHSVNNHNDEFSCIQKSFNDGKIYLMTVKFKEFDTGSK